MKKKTILFGTIGFCLFLFLEWRVGAAYNGFRNQGDGKYYRWNAETLWALRPNIDVTINGREVHTNSMGFRGTEEYPLESERELRIVTVGDSRAYGIAVGDEYTFSHVLQTRLREDGVDAEVINTGTPGYTVVQSRAKLEQMLAYKPQIAVLCAGYNDRRYLLLSPPDSQESFRRIAFVRKCASVLQWSNLVYAFTYEAGKRKLDALRDNPPSLLEVNVRVPKSTFQNELEDFVSFCRENEIIPIFITVNQNPCVFEITNEAFQLYKENFYQKAIDLLNENLSNMHAAAAAYGRYLLGECYRELGDREKASEYFHDHEPTGSLHGEAILREQSRYFDTIREIGKRENIPVVDSRQAILKVNQRLNDSELNEYLDWFEGEGIALVDGTPYKARSDGTVIDDRNFYRGRFVDECHYDRAGHILIGMELADTAASIWRDLP